MTTSRGNIAKSIAVVCGATAVAAAGYTYLTISRKKEEQGKETQDKVKNESGRADVDRCKDRNESTIEDEGKGPKDIPIHLQFDAGSNSNSNNANSSNALRRIQTPSTITIAYASTTNTCAKFAQHLHSSLRLSLLNTNASVQLCSVDELDWWDELLNNEDDVLPKSNETNTKTPPPIVIFILPTWTNGTLPQNNQTLLTSLEEITHDWRVAPKPLRHSSPKLKNRTLRVACFGMGSSAYDLSTFCKPAKDVFKMFMHLGALSLLSPPPRSSSVASSNGHVDATKKHGLGGVVGMGDDEVGDCAAVFRQWQDRVVERILQVEYKTVLNARGADLNGGNTTFTTGNVENVGECACKGDSPVVSSAAAGCCSNTSAEEKTCANDDNHEESSYGSEPSDDEEDYDDYDEEKEPEVMDLEDIGNAMNNSKSTSKTKEVKEMVTPKQAAALKKEGYKLIGTHSAVKLCRWTKHQLRGRGGCYKHTFYGITSYQCMEATPSLACANKCVFCWRHHKNPVGREWRWKTDDPHFIVDEAVKTHVNMIKEAKGIPGVQMDRWNEAHTVRHCALSLVGEPIMYPKIHDLLGDLHNRSISTFLVTNGQHPQAIEDLRPITQLYVSVDASTPESLVEIDRPLFKDAWDRLRRSLKCLKNKGQRTVARLTVVKGWNSNEIEGYAKLIALGHCSLVEVKGVTFCGKSDASNLNMSNTPWHHEVVALTQTLQKELARLRENSDGENTIPEYGLACEHKHSCSVLLARKDQFAIEDPLTGKCRWRTWINYEKFHELASMNAADPNFTFGVEDYLADTPAWALFGAEEEGFDPTDSRHRKKKKHPKYTKFDDAGIPTHDDNGQTLSAKERERLRGLMEAKKNEIGDGSTVITLKGGEKTIDDASLMFRGLVVTK